MPNIIDVEAPMPPPSHRWQGAHENTRIARITGGLVAMAFGVDPHVLLGRTRGTPRVAKARQTAMYLAHVTIPMSLTDAGRAFGRDRTTVAYACRVIELARDESAFDEYLTLLERDLTTALAGARP